MTTFRASDFHLEQPGALIAALPAVLGFVPEKSLVLVTLEDGELGCVMRVDLSARAASTPSTTWPTSPPPADPTRPSP